MTITETTRAHETRVEIDAPIEEVWKALTDAPSIARWFAPKMTVEPGPGGYVIADWGPGVEWRTAIEIWEPNKRLRLTETRERVLSASPVEEKLEPCFLIQDYFLETAKGKTILRLVHSGFGNSSEWDKEYEGTKGGWADCFLRLKHGLELHRNDVVHNVSLTWICSGLNYASALSRIEAAIPWQFVAVNRSKYNVCGLLPELNGSILTLSLQPAPVGSVAYLEQIYYGLSSQRVDEIQRDWRARLETMFPAG